MTLFRPNFHPGVTGAGNGPAAVDPLSLQSLKGQVSDAEWQLRCDLAATYRLVALFGWDDLVFTHISARLPDEGGKEIFLLNPFGVFFDEMTASCLLKVDVDGAIIGPSSYVSNPAGFVIHSAIHMARANAQCVLHLHTNAGVAVAAQAEGLRRYSQFAAVIYNDVGYHDYEGVATGLDERERLVQNLGEKNNLILRNHGTLSVGENCALAFGRAYFLERACQAQVSALSDTQSVNELLLPMADLVFAQSKPGFTKGIGDQFFWPGLLRRLHRQNPGWDV